MNDEVREIGLWRGSHGQRGQPNPLAFARRCGPVVRPFEQKPSGQEKVALSQLTNFLVEASQTATAIGCRLCVEALSVHVIRPEWRANPAISKP
jgi:hypothetical protein